MTLAPGERVLAAVKDATGAWVVGTNLHLHVPDATDRTGREHAVLGWERIDKATWHQDESRLVVAMLPIDGLPVARFGIVLPEPAHLPELVRERVTSTILVSQHVPLVGRSGAKIFGRRAPGSEEIAWSVVYDAGVDPASPAIEDRLQEQLAILRADLGV